MFYRQLFLICGFQICLFVCLHPVLMTSLSCLMYPQFLMHVTLLKYWWITQRERCRFASDRAMMAFEIIFLASCHCGIYYLVLLWPWFSHKSLVFAICGFQQHVHCSWIAVFSLNWNFTMVNHFLMISRGLEGVSPWQKTMLSSWYLYLSQIHQLCIVKMFKNHSPDLIFKILYFCTWNSSVDIIWNIF